MCRKHEGYKPASTSATQVFTSQICTGEMGRTELPNNYEIWLVGEGEGDETGSR